MDLYDYDESIRKGRFKVIAGVDEAGRGPLAGPVVAAAVILSDEIRINGIRDSKKVPSKERELLFKKIVLYSRAVGIGIAEVGEIEQANILWATKLAMRKAVIDLREKPDILLIDALTLPSLGVEQLPIVKGDAKSASIAAASIIAKVVRDRIMAHFHLVYPQYGFDSHKGYGTKAHLHKISQYGPCPIHRRGFRGVMSLELPLEEYI
ncbi:MAG: ribonuclease HII [Dissulfurispiraceae bacterium]